MLFFFEFARTNDAMSCIKTSLNKFIICSISTTTKHDICWIYTILIHSMIISTRWSSKWSFWRLSFNTWYAYVQFTFTIVVIQFFVSSTNIDFIARHVSKSLIIIEHMLSICNEFFFLISNFVVVKYVVMILIDSTYVEFVKTWFHFFNSFFVEIFIIEKT